MSNEKVFVLFSLVIGLSVKKKITETLFKKGIDLNYFDTSIYKKNIKI